MKQIDINKRFTEILSDYISKGYRVNAGTMSGTQGELAKVDFTDGNELIRVRMGNNLVKVQDERHCYSLKAMEITVGKYPEASKKKYLIDDNDSIRSVFDSDFEMIHEEKFYESNTGWRGNFNYYGTYDEAVAARAKHCNRLRESADSSYRHLDSTKSKKIALKILQKKKGYKSTRLKDIDSVRIYNNRDDCKRYEVKLHNKGNVLLYKVSL